MALVKETFPPHITTKDKVILFDGVCKLCHAWSQFILKHDKNRHFKLVSVQSKVGRDILQYFDYPTDFYETMLVVNGNVCMEKSRAFFFVMSTLGYPWKLMLFFRLVPRVVNDWLYDRVALNRYQIFGKYDQCILPKTEEKDRFLGNVDE